MTLAVNVRAIEVAFLSAIRPRYILPPFDLIFMISKLRHGIEARGLAVAFPGNALGLYLLLSYQHCCTIQLEAGQYDSGTAFTSAFRFECSRFTLTGSLWAVCDPLLLVLSGPAPSSTVSMH